MADIHLKLDPAGNSTVSYDSTVYRNGDVIRMTIQRYQALQLSCSRPCSMTGTLVAASKPLAVFVIGGFLYYVENHGRDHYMEQMPPVETYGLSFAIKQQPLQVEESGNVCDFLSCSDRIWIVSSQVDTKVKIADKGTTTETSMDLPGDLLIHQLDGNLAQVLTDKPVMVAQVLVSLPTTDGDMVMIAPINLYDDKDLVMFYVNSSLSAKRQVVLYSVDGSKPTQLMVDGLSVMFDGTDYGPFFNVSYKVMDYRLSDASFQVTVGNGDGSFSGHFADAGHAQMITSLSQNFDQGRSVSVICILYVLNTSNAIFFIFV